MTGAATPRFDLGISAFFHDSAAALTCDGVPFAAAQEERFSRVRHDFAFPKAAVSYCLDQAGIELNDLTSITFYEEPKEKFRRIVQSFVHAGPASLPVAASVARDWLSWKRSAQTRVARELADLGRGTPPPTRCCKHHRSHAASAFLPSPFSSAAVLCVDSVGEFHTTTIWHGQDADLKLKNAISYPHSLGLLYSAFTQFCGFRVDSGEYKLMGLAPYGTPVYAGKIRDELISLRDDGSFALNLAYFEFLQGKSMVGFAFERLFGRKMRHAEADLTQDDCDLAASVQVVIEAAIFALARAARRMTGDRRLCLAGGVSLNCVANGKLMASDLFDDIWVQPAGGDAGCALGAALNSYWSGRSRNRSRPPEPEDWMQGAYLGPEYSDIEIERFLKEHDYRYSRLDEDELLGTTADLIAAENVVGWFQGRMEFGPRAFPPLIGAGIGFFGVQFAPVFMGVLSLGCFAAAAYISAKASAGKSHVAEA